MSYGSEISEKEKKDRWAEIDQKVPGFIHDSVTSNPLKLGEVFNE